MGSANEFLSLKQWTGIYSAKCIKIGLSLKRQKKKLYEMDRIFFDQRLDSHPVIRTAERI